MQINLLNTFSVIVNGASLQFRSDKIRALFAYLVIEANRPHRRAALAALLWGELPQKEALTNLRVSLSRLRKTLVAVDEAEMLSVTRQTVQLNLDGKRHEVDTAVFQQAINQCHGYSPSNWWRRAACIPHLQKAVNLYREEFLAGLYLDDCPEFGAWRLTQGERYYQPFMMAVAALARHHLAIGNHHDAVAFARQQLAFEPWREATHRLLMQIFADMGQPEMAQAQFRQCQQILAEEMGVFPDETTIALAQQIGQESPKQPASAYEAENGTPFIGREAELQWLKVRLIDPSHRLLTLAGPGGIGKTRLATAAAAQIGHYFEDAVCFVSLADAGTIIDADEALLVSLADALEMQVDDKRPLLEQVTTFLHDRELLLILDNFEEVGAAVGLVLALLTASPRSTFLITSRVRLNCQPETVFTVEGLPVPPKSAEQAALNYASGQLFLERTRRYLPNFTPTVADLDHIADLCRLTGGMPLALLLAASWMEEFSCAELATAVRQNTRLLANRSTDILPRQHNVQAVFEHSWRHLSVAEQGALAQLSLFADGFGRQAATTVTQSSATTLSVLTAKCMIEAMGNGRYRFHPLLHQMVAEKLTEMPKSAASAKPQFIRWYTQFLQNHKVDLDGEGQLDALAAIRKESANVQQAWQLAVTAVDTNHIEQMTPLLAAFYDDTNQSKIGLALFQAAKQQLETAVSTETVAYTVVLLYLAQFLERRQRYDEAIVTLRQMLATATIASNWPLQGEGNYRLGCCLMRYSKLEQASVCLRKAERFFSRLEDGRALAKVFSTQGSILKELGQYADAQKKHEMSVELRREIGNPRMLSTGLSNYGYLLVRLGEYEEAILLLQESLAIDRQMAHEANICDGLINLSLAYNNLEKWQAAQDCSTEALALCRKMADWEGVGICLNNLGDTAIMQGAYEKSVAYLQESLQLQQKMENKVNLAFSLLHLGRAYLGLKKQEMARQALFDAEERAHALQLRPLWLACQVSIAQLNLVDGEREDAVRRIALVQGDDAAWKRTREDAAAILKTA